MRQIMAIRRLDETIINQIAAGEVVERPASVVKELVENALDAGATRIEIATAGGGKSLIRISDNGSGIAADELALAVSRHCTSKMGKNIADIRALGFRGEALPSIGSVSRLRLISRPAQAESATEVLVEGGKLTPPRPASGNQGTIVEVRDLFYATPARLKFLKSDRAEASAITDVVKRIAIAFPCVRFTLSGADRNLLDLPASSTDENQGRAQRIGQILGKEFIENSLYLDGEREGVRLTGLIGNPSYNRGNALHQFVYVNGRPIRDKMLGGAIRAAFSDALAHDRHGVAVLFLHLDPTYVDVNVHPAKADVRFRDPGLVRGLIIGTIRQTIMQAGLFTSTQGAAAMLERFQSQDAPPARLHPSFSNLSAPRHPVRSTPWSVETAQPFHRPLDMSVRADCAEEPGFSEQAGDFSVFPPAADLREEASISSDNLETNPLGAARAQIHKNYIIAQTQDSLIIVDQHAAHERLVYEALKNALYAKPLNAQMLLIPEIVELSEDEAAALLAHAKSLRQFGLGIEPFGAGAIAVHETPALLGEVDAQALIRDLADEAADFDSADGLKKMLDHVAATMACHGSVRSGRILRPQEMNALLRQMEAVPGSGTCNHGRPTYIELKLVDIERLFGRR